MLCQDSSSSPNPEPISRGMQPQYQPQATSSSSIPSRQTPTDSRIQSQQDPPQVHLAPLRPLSFSQLSGSYDHTACDARALPQIPVAPSLEEEGPNEQHYEARPSHLAEEKGESALSSYGHPSTLHNPSTNLDHRREHSWPPQSNLSSSSVPISDAALKSSHEVDVKEPDRGPSAGFGSPQSLESSNKTPTQADFATSIQNQGVSDSPAARGYETRYHEPVPSVRPRSAVNAADLAVDPANLQGKSFAPTQSSDSLQNQGTVDVSKDYTDKRAPNRSHALTKSEDSEAMFHTTATRADPSTGQSFDQSSAPVFRRTAAAASNPPAPRPFSFVENTPNQSERESRRSSQRAPSIDSVPSRMHPDRPPSPVSPQSSVVQETPVQRGRAGPIHYGAEHDFLPDSSKTSTPKRRSRSFSRLFKNSDRDSTPSDEQDPSKRRSRSISRLFKNPDLNDHPAFRQDALPAGGTDMPMHYYPEQISREDALIPRQQATEYQLDRVGPPPAQPVDARSRSRTNSKGSSSFINSSSTPAKGSPVRQVAQGQAVASPTASPITSQKKTKRTSLFRSLTGQKSHERDQGRSNGMQLTPEQHSDRLQQPGLVAPRESDSSMPFRDEATKVRNKLQRASTSGFQQHEQDGGKKKRFSAMGVSWHIACSQTEN